MADLKTAIDELVIANRILATEKVCDAFGHVSVRHPDDPKKFLLSRDRAPELFADAGWPDDGPFAYYGTADATSWFLVLAARRPGAVDVQAAADWLERALDRGGGLLRHAPGDWPALRQQA